jgi:hypothetical protein
VFQLAGWTFLMLSAFETLSSVFLCANLGDFGAHRTKCAYQTIMLAPPLLLCSGIALFLADTPRNRRLIAVIYWTIFALNIILWASEFERFTHANPIALSRVFSH